MTRPAAVALALGGWLVLSPIAAPACPTCNAEAGRRVRAGIGDDRFAANLAAVGLPLLVVAGIAAAVHGGRPGDATEDR